MDKKDIQLYLSAKQMDYATNSPFCPFVGPLTSYTFAVLATSVFPLMSSSISDFFENYLRTHRLFSDKEIATIKSLAIPRRLEKKQYLLRHGDVCRFHTFVCSGCLRSYRIDEKGREHIFSFSPANHWISDNVSLATETPSDEFIDAIEESAIIQLSSVSFKSLLSAIPGFDALNTKIITNACSASRERIYMMTNHQAEERYRQFIRLFPQLHQRLPVFMVASYIGVTRETLTRIRGNMIDLVAARNSYATPRPEK